MRLLILSCSTGQGHDTAAKAIKEAAERSGDICEIKSALMFLSNVADDVICDGHVFLYKRLPKLFGVGYRFEERHSPKFICNQLRRGVGKLYKYLEENHFDAIICTHTFGSILVNELKKKTGVKIPLMLVATDYTCCPGTPESDADLYFLAHPQITAEYEKNDIPAGKLRPCGIPVSSSFISSETRQNARHILGLPQNKKMVFLSCGSMGCGPMYKLAFLLSHRFHEDAVIVAACGNNKRLFERLAASDFPNVLPIPYTKNIPLYLDAADLYLTKAGGLSTTEAIFKETPIVYINAVPGCETRNIDFMTLNGFAAAAFSPEEAVDRVVFALNHPSSVQKGIKACKSELSSDPAQYIRDTVAEFISSGIK